jgi:hypothetical protein
LLLVDLPVIPAAAAVAISAAVVVASRFLPSVLGATSESFADALERFIAAPADHLIITQETLDAAAEAAAAAATLQGSSAAAAARQSPGSKEAKKAAKKAAKQQGQLVQQLVAKQAIAAEAKMAQMAADGEHTDATTAMYCLLQVSPCVCVCPCVSSMQPHAWFCLKFVCTEVALVLRCCWACQVPSGWCVGATAPRG